MDSTTSQMPSPSLTIFSSGLRVNNSHSRSERLVHQDSGTPALSFSTATAPPPSISSRGRTPPPLPLYVGPASAHLARPTFSAECARSSAPSSEPPPRLVYEILRTEFASSPRLSKRGLLARLWPRSLEQSATLASRGTLSAGERARTSWPQRPLSQRSSQQENGARPLSSSTSRTRTLTLG